MSKRLRIAVFVHTFPSVSETFVLDQVVGLLDRGHRVDIYALYGGERVAHPQIARYKLDQRIEPLVGWVMESTSRKAVRGACGLMSHPVRTVRALGSMVRGGWGDVRLWAEALCTAAARYPQRSESYDVLHAHFGPVAAIVARMRALGFFHGPLLATFHGTDAMVGPSRWGHQVYDYLFRSAAGITVNTPFLRDRLIALGAPVGRLELLPVGVSPADVPFVERSRRQGEPLRLLTIGRLVECKGIEYAIRALPLIRQHEPHVRLTVVGDGPLRRELEALTERLGVSDAVEFAGAQPWSYVRQALMDAHMYLHPGVVASDGSVEAQGRTVVEAQAAGLPVVASRVGGIPSVLGEGAGVGVSPGDPGALASAVLDLARRSEEWSEIGRCGRRHVENTFNNEKLIDQYERILHRLSV